MRVVDLLEQMGLPFAEVAFNNPPDETYLIFNDEITRRGADTLNCLSEHSVSLEVYSYDFFDRESVATVANTLDRHAIPYKKFDTSYINSEHLYCTRFEFSMLAKDSLSERFLADFYGG